MKYVIIIIVVVVVLILWMMKPQSTAEATQGTLSDIPRYLEALLKSDDPHAFLVITHESSGDFLQFTAGEDTIQMDFPVITEQQKSKAEEIKNTCSSLGLTLEENAGSGGEKFYDWNLSGTPYEMSATIATVLKQTFGVNPQNQLIFQHDGLTMK